MIYGPRSAGLLAALLRAPCLRAHLAAMLHFTLARYAKGCDAGKGKDGVGQA